MMAVILAGGEGTRLRPLTYKIPKALIPIQGKTLTEQVFAIYKKVGVTDIYLSVAYLADRIKEYFGDGGNFGFEIKYLEEKKRMGTAGPLLLLKSQGRIPQEHFFMSNGDNLFALDLKEMLEFHTRNDAVATIALTQVKDPTHFGIAKPEGEKILAFIEKPTIEEAPSLYASSGYYILSPAAFNYLPNQDFAMMENDIWPAIAKDGKLFGFKSEAQWFDTGTPQRHQQVEKEWRGV